MKAMRVACPIELSQSEREILTKWSKGRSTQARLQQRAQIVLLAAGGLDNKQIAERLMMDERTVGLWRRRYSEKRAEGIVKDAPRGGRRPKERRKLIQTIIDKTTQEKPRSATHWSTRTLAKELGINHTLIHRVWKAHELKPHLSRTFKLSNDKHFVEKVEDVVGLYMNPPDHALVLSVDEKSQIQALDRTQPGLPFKKGRCGTMTHDYKRNGTTTLFAALELLKGQVIGACMKRHRHQEWLKFLRQIDRQTPANLDLHLIADNYATHKNPQVKAWLLKHPRFHMHFIPTSASWLNLIERWFREITQKRIRRGVFHSVQELVDAITDYINTYNQDPRPLIWTAKAKDIIAKVKRARATLINSQQDETLH
jgi:transposase